MKRLYSRYFCLSLILLSGLFSRTSLAQSPGMIIRPATGSGRSILDPNLDNFVSAGSSGFTGRDADTNQLEIKFKVIKPVFFEPTSDLLRGPSTGYPDLVTAVDSSGFYVATDGSRLLFRMRIGDYIPGSKGYTVLVDTDGLFGNTGLLADPGYTPPGNGRAGNPGFEFEISLQTNFQLAVYNTDTFGKTVLKCANTPASAYSQVAVAASFTSGNPDYFIDFYVPFSQLGINANTPLRFASTTVVAPQPALGGPMSDIFGYATINDPMAAWTTVVQQSAPLTPAAISSAAYVPVCTQAPAVTPPAVGANSVSGTWTRLDNTRAGTARIYLYRNGFLTDSTTASSGAGWTIPVSSPVVDTSTFSARARALGEGNCFQSPVVSAVKCGGTVSARPGGFVTCVSNKGIDGTYSVSNTRVRIYQKVLPGVNAGGFLLYADSAAAPANFASITTPFVLHDNTTKAWKCDGLNGNGQPGTVSNSACTGGSSAADMPANTPMAVTAQEPGKCESAPVFICPNGTLTATPVISGQYLLPGSSVRGTSVAGAYMRLYVDSVLRGSVYADAAGAYSFGNPGLAAGSRVEVYAQANTTPATCVSAATTRTVQNQTTPPVIATDASGFLMPAVTTVAGTSSEVNTTSVFLYKRSGSSVTALGQTAVTNGAWSMSGIAALSAGEVYFATQQAPSSALSDTSNLGFVPASVTSSCASFPQTTYPASTGSISGTVSPGLGGGKVYLYIDGALADSATNVGTAFTINTNTTAFNTLYSGAVLTLTARSTGGAEKLGCGTGSQATVTCSAFGAATLSLSPAAIRPGNTTTAAATGTIPGLLYTLVAAPDNGTAYGTGVFATGTGVSIPSYAFSNTGSYPMSLRAVNLAEGGSCVAQSNLATLVVTNGPLPLQLLSFDASREATGVRLRWRIASTSPVEEVTVEKSSDGRDFNAIGVVAAAGTGPQERGYSFTDASVSGGVYRLKLRAADGTVSYSGQLRIQAAGAAVTAAGLYPNPFYDQVQVSFGLARSGRASLSLFAVNGLALSSAVADHAAGSHTMALRGLSQLPAGIYLVRLAVDGNEQGIWRVVKR